MLIKYEDDAQVSELSLCPNTAEAGLFSNVAENVKRGLPGLNLHEAMDRPCAIVGGGPSLAASLEKLREFKNKGGKVFALNNAARYLSEQGIKADAQIIVDGRECNVAFVGEAWTDQAYICSQCHPALFEKCKEIGYPVTIWHPAIDELQKYVPANEYMVMSHLTVGLSAMSLVYTLGHRHIHLFGYDSCHAEGKSHAYEQDINKRDHLVQVAVDNRVFTCSITMAGQATAFQRVGEMLRDLGCIIDIHGDGLLPHLVNYWTRIETQKILSAVYDLGFSPPTYDFVTFLAEAERYRIANGFDLIDVVFQPGPMFGFRDDNLPPDVETRKGMLWRVCVAMAKLLPSVRNVTVLKDRELIKGSVFPEHYDTDAHPLSHYGTCYLKNGFPMLKASEYATKQVAMRFSKPYATISLREAKHWTSRNSNIPEWAKVAQWLMDNNIQPVVIPDTEGDGLSVYGNSVSFEAASFDIDMRCALYEGAVINLGVLNGPMALCAFLDCKYLIFNIVVEDAIASSTKFLAAHGFHDGDTFSNNGKLIWKKDTAENILPELEYLMEKTSCPA